MHLLQLLLQRLNLVSILLDSRSIGRGVELREKIGNKVTVPRDKTLAVNVIYRVLGCMGTSHHMQTLNTLNLLQHKHALLCVDDQARLTVRRQLLAGGRGSELSVRPG